MFSYEKSTHSSLVKTSTSVIEDIVAVFPRWLSTIAFESKGLIMKHAMDVAIMLDALAYDPRLDLKYLIPVNQNTLKQGCFFFPPLD
jgi:hypothetical protein